MIMLTESPQLWDAISPAIDYGKRILKRQVRRGEAAFWQVQSAPVLLLVRPEGKQMVICCAAGRNLRQAQQEIINHAQSKGYSSIRWHTYRPDTLKKAMQGLGTFVSVRKAFLRPPEYIYTLILQPTL